MFTVKDEVWPQTDRQPSFHHNSNEPVQFAVFSSIHPIQVSAVNELVDEPIRANERIEEKERSYVRLDALGNVPNKDTYDQASTMRLAGLSSEASNRSCLKSNLLFSFKYVERPWTPIAKGG